jgi:hypothetical protein
LFILKSRRNGNIPEAGPSFFLSSFLLLLLLFLLLSLSPLLSFSSLLSSLSYPSIFSFFLYEN